MPSAFKNLSKKYDVVLGDLSGKIDNILDILCSVATHVIILSDKKQPKEL